MKRKTTNIRVADPLKNTHRFMQTLEFIEKYVKEHYAFPTTRAMVRNGIAKSTNTCRYHVGRLIQLGLLSFDEETGFYVTGSLWLSPDERRSLESELGRSIRN